MREDGLHDSIAMELVQIIRRHLDEAGDADISFKVALYHNGKCLVKLGHVAVQDPAVLNDAKIES